MKQSFMRLVWKKGDRLQLADLGHTSGGGFPLKSPVGFGLEPLAGFIGIPTLASAHQADAE